MHGELAGLEINRDYFIYEPVYTVYIFSDYRDLFI